jgi:hypothetical protein
MPFWFKRQERKQGKESRLQEEERRQSELELRLQEEERRQSELELRLLEERRQRELEARLLVERRQSSKLKKASHERAENAPAENKAIFAMDSVISDNIRNELKLRRLEGNPSFLGGLVVLVGGFEHAWCTTCKEYLHWRWPDTGPLVLDILDKSLQSDGSYYTQDRAISHGKCQGHLGFTLLHEKKDWNFMVETRDPFDGIETFLDEIANILAWISCAFSANDGTGLQVAKPLLQNREHRIRITTTQIIDIPSQGGQPCWLPLFPRMVLAWGFYIPSRAEGMQGLELPFDMMTDLAGIDFPVVEDGGIRLEGFYTVLYPICRTTTFSGTSLQWHLCYASEEERADCNALEEFKAGKPPKTWYQTKDLEDLRLSGRHFLGWCSHSTVELGTRRQDYNQVSWTRASVKEKSAVESSTTLALNLGAHGVGLCANRTWRRASTARNPFEDREQNFIQSILFGMKQQVLLYHWSKQQAWLVPKTSVLLHLVLTSMHNMARNDPNLAFQYPYAESGHDGGKNAYESLKAHRNDVLPLGEPDDNYYLKDLVKIFLYAFDKLARRSKSRINAKVEGWEFMDLVSPPQYFDYKQDSLTISLLGGWAKLLPRIPLVLFYDGIRDPIVPDDQSRVCETWQRMPADQNLMAMTMVSLRDFAQRSQDLRTFGRLSDCCFWNSENHPFKHDGLPCRGCDPIQSIWVSEGRKPPVDIFEQLEGAIIFSPHSRMFKGIL